MRPNLQKTADLVTFTEEILNGKLHFLCSGALSINYSEKHFTYCKYSCFFIRSILLTVNARVFL